MLHDVLTPASIGILIGVITTALLGSLSYFFKAVVERRRLLRRTLYLLLEIWNYLNGSLPAQTSDFINAYLEEFENSLRRAGIKDVISPDIKTAIANQMAILTNTLNSHRSTEFLNDYSQMTKELSYSLPFIAFRLNGQQDLLQLLTDIDNQLKSAATTGEDNSDALRQFHVNNALSISHDAQKSALNELEHCILLIAGSIGPITKFKSWTLIYRNKQRVKNLITTQAPPLLDKLISDLVQMAKQETPT